MISEIIKDKSRGWLVLVDLDKTLIDENYNPNMDVSSFRKIVTEVQNSGVTISLMSDSAGNTLKYWKEKFGFNGPIISENGIEIVWPNHSISVLKNSSINWPSLKQKIYDKFLQQLPDIPILKENYLLFKSGKMSAPAKEFIVINPYRNSSFSAHVLQVGKNGFIGSNQLLFPKVTKLVDEVVADSGYNFYTKKDYNSDYTVIILSNIGVDKAIALPELRKAYKNCLFLAIGDGVTDTVLNGKVDCLCAVANASKDMKKISYYIANDTYTRGVFDILLKLKDV